MSAKRNEATSPREAEVAERRESDPGAAEALARELAAIVDDKLGEEIVVLNVRELVSYTDFMLIASARNERLAKAIHDEVYGQMKSRGLLPNRTEGLAEAHWIVLDYLDCVLHLFTPAEREHYRLERLWGEAPRLELGLAGELSE